MVVKPQTFEHSEGSYMINTTSLRHTTEKKKDSDKDLNEFEDARVDSDIEEGWNISCW